MVRILSSTELENMKNVEPVAWNRNQEIDVKEKLMKDIIEFYGDRWSMFSEQTKSVIDYYALRASQKGFVFHGSDKVAELFGVSRITVRKRMDELTHAGLLVKCYRRNKKSNGLGNIVFLFTSHQYFAKWQDYLSLPCKEQVEYQVEREENLRESKAQEPKKVSTYVLAQTSLKDLKIRTERLTHEFVSERVSKDFTRTVKPFFDDAFFIEELWKSVEIATREHWEKGYSFDYVEVAIESVQITIRKIKKLAHSGEKLDNPIGYFTNVFRKRYKAICLRESFCESVS